MVIPYKHGSAACLPRILFMACWHTITPGPAGRDCNGVATAALPRAHDAALPLPFTSTTHYLLVCLPTPCLSLHTFLPHLWTHFLPHTLHTFTTMHHLPLHARPLLALHHTLPPSLVRLPLGSTMPACLPRVALPHAATCLLHASIFTHARHCLCTLLPLTCALHTHVLNTHSQGTRPSPSIRSGSMTGINQGYQQWEERFRRWGTIPHSQWGPCATHAPGEPGLPASVLVHPSGSCCLLLVPGSVQDPPRIRNSDHQLHSEDNRDIGGGKRTESKDQVGIIVNRIGPGGIGLGMRRPISDIWQTAEAGYKSENQINGEGRDEWADHSNVGRYYNQFWEVGGLIHGVGWWGCENS